MRQTTQVTVDRIDGDLAVLVDETSQATVPLAWLPTGAVEGTVLDLTLSHNPDAEKALGDRIRDLQSGFSGGDIEL